VGKPTKRGTDRTGEQEGNNKRQCKDEANMNTEEIITFGAEELKAKEQVNVNNNGSDDLNDGFNVDITDPNDKCIVYYNWLANITTMNDAHDQPA
jgi:hypothetical protein